MYEIRAEIYTYTKCVCIHILTATVCAHVRVYVWACACIYMQTLDPKDSTMSMRMDTITKLRGENHTYTYTDKYIVYTGPVTDTIKNVMRKFAKCVQLPLHSTLSKFFPSLMSLITVLLPTAALHFQMNYNITKPKATQIIYYNALLYQ